MKDYPDFGYTPANLRHLLKSTGLTQAEAAKMLDVVLRTMQKWVSPLDAKYHSDMPLQKWQELQNKVQHFKKNE